MGLRGYGGLRTVKWRAPGTGGFTHTVAFSHHTRLLSGLRSDTATWVGRNNIYTINWKCSPVDHQGGNKVVRMVDQEAATFSESCFHQIALWALDGFSEGEQKRCSL